MDTFDQIPAAGLCRIHMDPEKPVPGLGHHRVLRELPDEAIDAFVGARRPGFGLAAAADRDPPHGRRPGPRRPDGGALSHLDADWVMFGIGMPMTPELGEAIEGSPRPLRRGDGALGRRRRLLQLRRAPLRRRRDPPARGLLPPRRGKAPAGTPTAASSATTRSRSTRRLRQIYQRLSLPACGKRHRPLRRDR